MTIREMLKKKNRPFTFRQFPLPLMSAFLKRLAFVVVLLAATIYLAFLLAPTPLSSKIPVLLLPIVLLVFFSYAALFVYLIAATGTYQIIEGVCIESPNTPEIKNLFKKKASSFFSPVKRMTCVVEGTDGEYYRILCSSSKHLPRQGHWTVLYCPITKDKPETLDSGEIQILSYLSIQSYSKRKKDKEVEQEAENS
jgi:hypothetical protein